MLCWVQWRVRRAPQKNGRGTGSCSGKIAIDWADHAYAVKLVTWARQHLSEHASACADGLAGNPATLL